MEEADQLCERVAIIDQGRIVALDTPAALKSSVGADAAVRVSAEGDLEELGRVLREGIAGARDATVVGGQVAPRRPGHLRRPAGGRADRRARRLHRHRPVGLRDDPRDRVHQPHREGPPRMTATIAPPPSTGASVAPLRTSTAVGLRRAAPPRPHGAAQEPEGVHPPHGPAAAAARLRVHLRLPEDRPGRRRQRGRSHRVLERAGRRRGRHRDPLPGHPGGVAPAGAGVRLHPGDRGPGARTAPRAARRLREDRGRRSPVPVRRADRVPDRHGGAGDARPPRRQLVDPADHDPARLHHERARSGSSSARPSSPGPCRCSSA